MTRKTLVAAAAVSLSLAAALLFLWPHVRAQVVLGIPLERQLGFEPSSPFTEDPHYFMNLREVVAVSRVAPRSPAASAGLRSGDVFLDYCGRDKGFSALFRDLEAARGKRFCTAVVPLSERGPLEQRPRRQICMAVPLKQ